MATGNLVKDFSDEATCSLCLEHFDDPMTIDCGHNFCQACITQCLEKIGPSCPQCRQPISPRNFKPNRPLANLVELIKKLEQEKREKENKGVCWKHQEPLRLFCKEDQMLICVVCHISKEHKDHNVFPLDTTHNAASQEYKGKIKNQIPLLEQKRKELEALRLDEEQKSQILLILLKKERQNGLSAFEKLQKTLEEKKHTWICCLDGLEKKMKKNREENAAELLNQISDLSSLIAEIEQKCQQPASEFLQVTADHLDTCKSTEDRNLVFKSCQELESSLTVFTYKRKILGKIFKEFQDSLEKTLQDGDVAQQSLKEALQMGEVARGNINKLLTQSSSVMPHPGRLDAPYVNMRSETGPTPEPGMGWLRRQLPGTDSHECGPLAEMPTSWSPGELMTLSKQFPPVCEDPIKFQNLLGTIMRVYKPSREDVDLLLQELMPQRLLKTLRKRAKWPVPGQREPQDWDLAQARGDLVEAVLTFCASGVDWCKINTCKQKKGEDPADYMQRLTQIFEKHSGITGGVNTAPQAVVSFFVNGLLPEVSKQLKLNCIGWEGKKLDAVLAAAKHFYRQLKKKQEKLPGQQGGGDRIMGGRRMALGPMPGPPHPAGACFLCGELSHWKRNCPYQAKYRPWAFQGPQRQPGWAARQQAREFSPPPPQFLGSGPPGRQGTQQNEMVQGYPYLEQVY